MVRTVSVMCAGLLMLWSYQGLCDEPEPPPPDIPVSGVDEGEPPRLQLVPLVKAPKPPKPPITAEQHRRSARAFTVGGAIMVINGLGTLVGAIFTAVKVAGYHRDPCPPGTREDCNSLSDGLQGIETFTMGALWVSTVVVSTVGAVLLWRGASHRRLRVVQPVLSLSPNGGSGGVQIRF